MLGEEVVVDYPIEDLEIINDCADSTLDISKFMLKCFESTVAVDIKSKGPLSVNANVSAILPFNFFEHNNSLAYFLLLISGDTSSIVFPTSKSAQNRHEIGKLFGAINLNIAELLDVQQEPITCAIRRAQK